MGSLPLKTSITTDDRFSQIENENIMVITHCQQVSQLDNPQKNCSGNEHAVNRMTNVVLEEAVD